MRPNQLNLEILSSLENFSCFVWRYRASHSRLVIKIVCGDVIEGDVFYLVLTTVLYFSGPMVWAGSNIRLGSNEEISQVYGKFLGDQNSLVNRPPEHNDWLLLIFEGAGQILCHGATLYENDFGE